MRTLTATAIVLTLAMPVPGAEPSVESASALPAGAVATEIAAAIASEGTRVRLDGKPLADVWLAREIAGPAPERPEPGVAYPRIAEGGLVGVARFESGWKDYRGRPVAAGTYTLRYAVLPSDGNHMGVSEYVDYLALVPAADDTSAARIASRKALDAMSRKASGTNHPAILCLVPAAKDAVPGIKKAADGALVVTLPWGGSALSLVVRGEAPPEGH
jgi:hypothetical protein